MTGGRTPKRAMASIAIAGFAVGALALPSCGGDDDGGDVSGEEATATATVTGSPSADQRQLIDPGDGGRYRPRIEPGAFVETIDHPYNPLHVGSRWIYRSTGEDGEVERIEVEVLDERRVVMGVSTVVVHDVVSVDGDVVEDTYDWYAQDRRGNVWYFGEDTTAYEDGEADIAGSWKAGVDGALPGIVMPARPAVSDIGYRQEYYPGEAEDMGEIIAIGGSATTPAGDFDDVIVTRDWTPLEPDVVEEKTYARGVGLVHESKPTSPDEVVELIEFDAS